MIKILFLLFFLPSSLLAWERKIDGNTDIRVNLKGAIEGADLIVVGQTERVEVIMPEPTENFDRRALIKVLRIFKGKKPKGEFFVYYKMDYSNATSIPSALLGVGKKAVLFVKGNSKKVAYQSLGSFDFFGYPMKIESEPKGAYCTFKALEAYSKKKPMEEVVKTSFECPYPRMLNTKVKK